MVVFCVFFSSRRRHTRYWRDWSSDVCSSDLVSKSHFYFFYLFIIFFFSPTHSFGFFHKMSRILGISCKARNLDFAGILIDDTSAFGFCYKRTFLISVIQSVAVTLRYLVHFVFKFRVILNCRQTKLLYRSV